MHSGCRIEQVYRCRELIDFRKSIGGLSVLVERELALNPFGGALYVFVNRQRNKIKVLYWHRNGVYPVRDIIWLTQKIPTAISQGDWKGAAFSVY